MESGYLNECWKSYTIGKKGKRQVKIHYVNVLLIKSSGNYNC